MTNAFWEFSLKVYSTPEVAAECLALQHKFGLDINLLLFVTYVGERKLVLWSVFRTRAGLARENYETFTTCANNSQVRLAAAATNAKPARTTS
jgi:hypothetical protein